MYQTILVPVDGSQRAEAIFSHLTDLAKAKDAKLVFLKVEEGPLLLERDEVIDAESYRKQYDGRIEKARTYLASLERKFREQGIRSETRMAFGPVVKAILNVASETGADLIALATHGFSGLARVSFGSVAAGVLQAAGIPILLIRSCNGQ